MVGITQRKYNFVREYVPIIYPTLSSMWLIFSRIFLLFLVPIDINRFFLVCWVCFFPIYNTLLRAEVRVEYHAKGDARSFGRDVVTVSAPDLLRVSARTSMGSQGTMGFWQPKHYCNENGENMMGTTNKDGSSKRTHSFNSLKMSGHVSSKRIYDRLKHFPFEHNFVFHCYCWWGFQRWAMRTEYIQILGMMQVVDCT